MTPASKPSAAALRSAAPVSDALYAINERGLDCTPIRGEDPAPIDTNRKRLAPNGRPGPDDDLFLAALEGSPAKAKAEE
jgi:hypothetical protein